MKATKINLLSVSGLIALALMIGGPIAALASDAETSATATRGRTGTAAATAHYAGEVGFARTTTSTGAVNVARAVAVGVDENGVSLSVSTAVAPRSGPAVATNFNLSIGTNGEVARSTGRAEAVGGAARTVSAGGKASSTPAGSVAISHASGSTSCGGVVRVNTRSHHEPERVVVKRVIRVR